MGSWTFIIIQTYAFRYNYRSQNWKNVTSLSFLSFPRFFVSGTNFPDENSQKKTRKSVTLETQRPIKTFRLLIDVREIHLLHATFHGNQRSTRLATPRTTIA